LLYVTVSVVNQPKQPTVNKGGFSIAEMIKQRAQKNPINQVPSI
jgi:hypothetical protein